MSLQLYCEKWTLPVINDLVKTFVGEHIGTGVYREVYGNLQDRSTVIKIERQECSGKMANAIEFEIWNYAGNEHKLEQWFAPCVSLSMGGLVLVQKRTRPVKIEDLRAHLPKVPTFFTDLKVGNWGWLGDRIVCHDYANLHFSVGITGKKMRNADWWEER